MPHACMIIDLPCLTQRSEESIGRNKLEKGHRLTVLDCPCALITCAFILLSFWGLGLAALSMCRSILRRDRHNYGEVAKCD